MPTISYAQNGEDIILARVFREPTGFYIDVGAAHPKSHSVTKLFYDRGWTGVNVEPQADFYRGLVDDRPRDVNLNVAVSDHAGTATFHEVENNIGRSTLDAGTAADARSGGERVVSRPIMVMTLDGICREHALGRQIDFLKVDVEGHEREVLLGANLGRWRPRVLVVEATKPNSPEPTHADWEPIVLAQRYHFAFFDGLNRYYVRAEDEALIPRLAVPVNVLDDYVPLDLHEARVLAAAYKANEERAIAVMLEARDEAARARGEAQQTQADLAQARGETRQAQLEATQARGGTAEANTALTAARGDAARSADAVRRLTEELEAARRQLAGEQAALDSALAQLEVARRQGAELLAERSELRRAIGTMVRRSALDSALTILAETRAHLDAVRGAALLGV